MPNVICFFFFKKQANTAAWPWTIFHTPRKTLAKLQPEQVKPDTQVRHTVV